MIDDSLLLQLKDIGMSEYEAKVYAMLSALRVANAREIHDHTTIPRGKIYETLTSLARKGFIVSSGKTPVRYSPIDITETCERLKRESAQSLDELYRRLKDLETDTPEPLMQGYKLCTDWTRDCQVRMIFRRAKSEIIYLCNDEEFLTRYTGDIAGAGKRVHLYLVVGKRELVPFSPVSCYLGGNDLHSSIFSPKYEENSGLSVKLLMIADRRESLSILEENGVISGIFIFPDVYAGYLSRKIIHEIQPSDKPVNKKG